MQAFWFFKETGKLSKHSERNMERPSKPSISILFTDTVSRTLAFRGLPKTVKLLSRLKKNSKRPVLDFKLYQSISWDTRWNIFNLFDGPNATESNDHDIFYIKKGSTFFRKFKQEGYLTAYYSDLCHNWVSNLNILEEIHGVNFLGQKACTTKSHLNMFKIVKHLIFINESEV